MSLAPSPVVAIDLGGTNALAGVIDPDGTVRSRARLRRPESAMPR